MDVLEKAGFEKSSHMVYGQIGHIKKNQKGGFVGICKVHPTRNFNPANRRPIEEEGVIYLYRYDKFRKVTSECGRYKEPVSRLLYVVVCRDIEDALAKMAVLNKLV